MKHKYYFVVIVAHRSGVLRLICTILQLQPQMHHDGLPITYVAPHSL